MQTDRGWWARRLGGESNDSDQRAPSTDQQFTQHYQQQQPQQYPSQGQNFQPQQISVTPENLFQAMNYWQGGEATRTEIYRCPRCGDPHFYSRSQGAARGPAPAPMCFGCGYNGMFEQGDPGVWESGAA